MKFFCYLFTVFFSLVVFGQQDKYPQDYFLFPIKPNQQNFLAGTMGELRSNHFHAGIDIKTEQKIGLPVYAAADGYISRIKVSPFGYGNALYIAHPNGYTTVYAHLENFSPKMDSVVLKLQYQQKSFSIDQYFKKNQYTVKKGDIIAAGGNTGGSQGPHLHFEIRDQNQHVLNPLYFGFSEIKDDIAPKIKKLSLTSFGKGSHVKNQLGTQIFTPKRLNGKQYKIYETIRVQGKIGIGIKANDQLNGASNQNGINQIIVKVDSQEVYHFHNEEISFSKKLHMNQHIDFESYRKGKGRFHKCYLDDGNRLKGYTVDENKGFLMINDTLIHHIAITTYDSYKNASTLTFKLKGEKTQKNKKVVVGRYEKITHEIHKNTLKMTIQHADSMRTPTLFVNKKARRLKAEYQYAGKSVYLWDLQKGLPDSLVTNKQSYPFHFIYKIPSPNSFDYYHKKFNVSFSKHTLFDTLYLEMEAKGDTFAFGNTTTPFAKRFSLLLKPHYEVTNKEKTHVYEIRGNRLSFVGGTWKNNYIGFRTRGLATYTLSEDHKPPAIKYLGKRKQQVSFRIKDSKSGIRSFNAYLNGKWLLMKYDYKANRIWSERLDKSKPLKGKLVLEVVDKANNKKIYSIQL